MHFGEGPRIRTERKGVADGASDIMLRRGAGSAVNQRLTLFWSVKVLTIHSDQYLDSLRCHLHPYSPHCRTHDALLFASTCSFSWGCARQRLWPYASITWSRALLSFFVEILQVVASIDSPLAAQADGCAADEWNPELDAGIRDHITSSGSISAIKNSMRRKGCE